MFHWVCSDKIPEGTVASSLSKGDPPIQPMHPWQRPSSFSLGWLAGAVGPLDFQFL